MTHPPSSLAPHFLLLSLLFIYLFFSSSCAHSPPLTCWAVDDVQAVLSVIARNNFTIVAREALHLSPARVEQLYADLAAQPYFDDVRTHGACMRACIRMHPSVRACECVLPCMRAAEIC